MSRYWTLALLRDVSQTIVISLAEEEIDTADDEWLENPTLGAESAIKGAFTISIQSFLSTLPAQQQPVNSFDFNIASNPVNVGVEHGTPSTTPIVIDNNNGFFTDASFVERFENGHIVDSNGEEYFITTALHNSPPSLSEPFAGHPKITFEVHLKVGQAAPVFTASYSVKSKDILYDGGVVYYPIASILRHLGSNPVNQSDITNLRFVVDSEELKRVSLDNAYDCAGSGLGRVINVDSGAVRLDGTTNTNVLEINKISGSGSCIDITNNGSGHDIEGNANSWYVDKDGNAYFNSVSAENLGGITIFRENYLGSDGTGPGYRIYSLVNYYYIGNDSLTVFLDGHIQRVGDDYLETDSHTVTFTSDINPFQRVTFDIGRKLGAGFGAVHNEIAIEGQTVIHLPFEYAPGTSHIDVHVNGVLKNIIDDYVENDSSTVTLLVPRKTGDKIVVRMARDALTSPYIHAESHEHGADAIHNLVLTTLELESAVNGFVMKSPNGNRWRVTMTNAGTFVISAI